MKDLRYAHSKRRIGLELALKCLLELRGIRLRRDDCQNIGCVSACLLPIMPGLCRTSDVAISIVECEKLQHHECMRFGDSERSGKFQAVRQSANELMGFRFGNRDGAASRKAGNPELMFHDKRAVECARLLAAECDASDPSTGLYGEGLTIALLSACFQGRPQKENSGLSVSQLRLVLDFIREHLDLSVSVFQLARLVDLSSSQFARMFKASTGVSPHRYQLNARIGKAQELLLMKGESLSMVAVATGFADQSHFTRTFKRVTGATPHEWHQNRTR